MESFYKLDEILRERRASGRDYVEFVRVPAMSCGVYVLAAGATDRQKPHAEDEVYYVIRGEARMTVHGDAGVQERDVRPGDVILVQAGQEHRFHDITSELVVLVAFAPAESQ
jgi:mannose-6-phosphate isomerase-like protein (cupin superfamily)